MTPFTAEERADLERIAGELHRLVAVMKHVEQMWPETPQRTYLRASIDYAEATQLSQLQDNLADQKLTSRQLFTSLSGLARGLGEISSYVTGEDPEILALVAKINEQAVQGRRRAYEREHGPLPR